MPEKAEFCPNCGAVTKKARAAETKVSVAKYLQVGLFGAFLSVTIQLFSFVPLYFVPSFLASVIIIYLFKVGKLKDAMITAMTVYLIEEAVTSALVLGPVYLDNIPLADLYGDYVPTLVDVILYVAGPITAIIAGYIGAGLVSGGKKEPAPSPYGRREERGPGGIVYSLKRNTGKASAPSPDKV